MRILFSSASFSSVGFGNKHKAPDRHHHDPAQANGKSSSTPLDGVKANAKGRKKVIDEVLLLGLLAKDQQFQAAEVTTVLMQAHNTAVLNIRSTRLGGELPCKSLPQLVLKEYLKQLQQAVAHWQRVLTREIAAQQKASRLQPENGLLRAAKAPRQLVNIQRKGAVDLTITQMEQLLKGHKPQAQAWTLPEMIAFLSQIPFKVDVADEISSHYIPVRGGFGLPGGGGRLRGTTTYS